MTIISGRGERIWRGLVTQSGTGIPTATVLENGLSGTIVWARVSQGVYTGTLTGAFTADKTFVSISNGDAGSGVPGVTAYRANANAIQINTFLDGMGADGVLSGTALEILVYP